MGKPAAECADDGAKIKIATVAEDKENDLIVYKYTVTAGRIIGQGASIVWDLSGAAAGKYSIVAGSDDGCGVCGRTMTKEIEIKAAPDVEKISFSKDTVYFWCPMPKRSPHSYCTKEEMVLGVTTTAKNVHKGLVFYYTVTGGKIVGDGPNVKWDMADTLPGTYSIAVGIGKDGVILGTIVTRRINEEICPVCDLPCSCPSVSVSGPEQPVRPGDTVVFKSNVRPVDEESLIPGSRAQKLSFQWSVSAGTILNDPGSSTIMVKIPANFEGASVEAILTMLEGFDRRCTCLTSYPVQVNVSGTAGKSVPQLK
jgi:hypothetical protein